MIKKSISNICLTLLLATGFIILLNLPFVISQARGYLLMRPKIQTASVQPPAPSLAARTIYIPKINLSAPLVYPNSNKETKIQLALQSGVAHYFGTAGPGEYGNAVFVGHSSDYPWRKGKYKTVFALLPRLTAGDKIYISDDSDTFAYKVIKTKIVKRDDFTIFHQAGYKLKLLTLQTSYPLGTALKRFIVVAEMIDKATN